APPAPSSAPSLPTPIPRNHPRPHHVAHPLLPALRYEGPALRVEGSALLPSSTPMLPQHSTPHRHEPSHPSPGVCFLAPGFATHQWMPAPGDGFSPRQNEWSTSRSIRRVFFNLQTPTSLQKTISFKINRLQTPGGGGYPPSGYGPGGSLTL